MPDSPDTSAAAIVRDHAFEPRQTVIALGDLPAPYAKVYLPPNEYLCGHRDRDGRLCRLAEAAHIR
jgi:hypothetical protein